MKPPICDVCGLDFRSNPASGGLVYFKKTTAPDESGRPGHPSNAEWFCSLHHGIASSYSNLRIGDAQSRIRRVAFIRTVVLLVGTSVISAAIAMGGLLVGSFVANTPGLFVGTLAGGMTGVLSSGLIAAAMEYLPRPVVPAAITGGLLGFLMAAVLTIGGSTTFGTPFIPIASCLFIGFGFLVGRGLAARRLAMDEE